MERVQPAPQGSDRERRAHLEQLQTDLRRAREALSRPEPTPEASLLELEAELAQAVASAKAAGERVHALKQTVAELTDRGEELRRTLVEEKVLALGRSRRDRYIDPIGQVDQRLVFAAILGYVLLVVFVALTGHH